MKGGKLARKKHFQHGSLFKRGKRNKVWVARYREPVIGPNGGNEFVRRSEILGTVAELPTRGDAEMILSDRLRRLNSADYHPRSCCSFRAFVQDVEAASAAHTEVRKQEHYKYVLTIHLLPVFRQCPVALDLAGMQSRIFWRENYKKDLSWRTVKHAERRLGTILGAAEFWELYRRQSCPQNQTSATWPQARKTVIDPGADSGLLEALPEPSRSLVWLLVLTGLRIGELLALRWQDVDLKAGLCV